MGGIGRVYYLLLSQIVRLRYLSCFAELTILCSSVTPLIYFVGYKPSLVGEIKSPQCKDVGESVKESKDKITKSCLPSLSVPYQIYTMLVSKGTRLDHSLLTDSVSSAQSIVGAGSLPLFYCTNAF